MILRHISLIDGSIISMRIIVANCSVIYSGRGDTTMKACVRAIIIKGDGAISIHHDVGNKPLNYMAKGNVHTESRDDDGNLLWNFDARKENLSITIYEMISDNEYELPTDDEGLTRDGTEDHLQEWLSDNPEEIGEGFTLVSREFRTNAGPVDLLLKDANGKYIAVEVKRVAMLPAVDQVNRYVNALKEEEEYSNVRGIVAALDIRPKTLVLAEKRDVECVTINENWKSRR